LKKAVKIIAFIPLCAAAVILTVFSKEAAGFVNDGLSVCAMSVIPSLFPYMVISHMIVSSRIFSSFNRLFYPVRIYGLPPKCGSAVLLGALCGFPVGAKTAVEMYKSGEISKTEAEVLICAANNTGPSFVVSVIGGTFFKSISFGWVLYFSQLLSSVIATLTVNRIVFPFSSCDAAVTYSQVKMPDLFTAVKDSVSSVLSVCGFILFFFVVSGFTSPLLYQISDTAAGIYSSFLEFCQGAGNAASIGGTKGRFLCGFAVGFSGISVFCQTASFTAAEGLSLKRCFCTKLLQGILTGILAAIIATENHVAVLSPVFAEIGLISVHPISAGLISAFLYIFSVNKIIKA